MTNLERYAVAPGVVSEHFDDEVIIVNMAKGHYYSLRGSAADVWQLLEHTAETDTITAHLLSGYAVGENEVRMAIAVFLAQLTEEQLITATVAPATGSPLPEPVRYERLPFYAPTLEVYTDMVDLLALDPIHDVDPVEGWPSKK